MARRVIHTLVDDLDGDLADESLAFGLDGVRYEIDLSAANAQRLRDALAPYVAAARKIGRGAVIGSGRGRTYLPERDSRRISRARNQAIREWGQQRGFDVSSRGRLSRDLVDLYRASGAGDDPAQ